MTYKNSIGDPSLDRPFYRLLGIKFLGLSDDSYYCLEITSNTDLENSRGEFHGGVIATLLDASIGVAVRGAFNNEVGATTVSLSINYLSAGKVKLFAKSKVMHLGKSLASGESLITDDSGIIVAQAIATMKILYPKSLESQRFSDER
jgi:acyl-CoA thioesterase